ncbi:MAG: lantibiotic dehydratase C-terminal domain-containing protein, partial [Actinomycetota bacterium]
KQGLYAWVTEDGHYLMIEISQGTDTKNGLFYKDLTKSDSAVVELLRRGLIKTFFFIRYSLGGPHLRLRVRPTAATSEGAIDALLDEHATRFFAAHPSDETRPSDEIRQRNRSTALDDPSADFDSVYANETLERFNFEPEVERYGGPEHLESAYDLFTLSSSMAIEAVSALTEVPRTRWLAAKLRYLAHQALASSDDPAMLDYVLSYPIRLWGAAQPRVIERGDAAFEKQHRAFVALMWREADTWRRGEATEMPGARWLGPAVRAVTRRLRHDPTVDVGEVAVSHLHMTANRLGINNAEELYLCRILERAVAELAEDDPELVSAAIAAGGPSMDSTSLDQWRTRCLASFVNSEEEPS